MAERAEPKLSDYDQHAKAWASSGEAQRRYCERLGLSYRRFKLARHRLIQGTTVGSDFKAVQVAASNPAILDETSNHLTLQWQSGRVTVSGTLSVHGLSSLLTVLTQHPC